MTFAEYWLPGRHAWHHLEFALYAALAVLLLYRPPRSLQGGWAAKFLDSHFGDMIGFYILHLAVALIIVGSVWNLVAVSDVGKQLLLPAMAVLKLTKSAGNGPAEAAPANVPTSAQSASAPLPGASAPPK